MGFEDTTFFFYLNKQVAHQITPFRHRGNPANENVDHHPHICDASYSANTLMYAAPFRIITERRQHAPFDAKDPRTWDNASSIKWLTVAFTKQQEIRRQAVWDCQQVEALKDGKRLRPLPAPPHDRRNLISFEKLCPAPYGGAYLAHLMEPIGFRSAFRIGVLRL